MKARTTILGFGAALALAACVQVGPSDDKPLHIIMDVNIKIQVEEAVMDLWDDVRAEAPASPGASVEVLPEENE
jgi:hypothetical protein